MKMPVQIPVLAVAACCAMALFAGCQHTSEPSSDASSAPAEPAPVVVEDRQTSTVAQQPDTPEEPREPEEPVSTGDDSLDAAVAAKLAQMTTEEKVAQLFVAIAESLCSDGSTLAYVDDDVRSNLERIPVAGICLLGENLVDEAQTRALLADLQSAATEQTGLDLLLAVDEEGGTVARVGANPAFAQTDPGDMRAIGDTGDAALARDAAKTIGSYLFDLGFNVDFAPVADVDTEEATTMEQRSFGTDPQRVADMVQAQVEGFHEAGMLCCAKHFPGIGSAAGDSHETGIVLNKDLDTLRSTDLVPFKAAVDAGVPLVMVGHISCPQITGDATPATFSSAIMTDLLREELGYTGVIVTDALNMGAATEVYGDAEASLQAFKAGADLLLMPTDLDAAYQSILRAVQSGDVSQERLDASVSRIVGMKLAYAAQTQQQRDAAARAADNADEQDKEQDSGLDQKDDAQQEADTQQTDAATAQQTTADRAALADNLVFSQDMRTSFVHGEKGAQYQKYIVLHDTEGNSDASGVINYWDSSGAGVAAHFIVNTDGSVVQCVPLDKITHHAGFGDTGHNAAYGVEDESRDDKVGTVPIGDWAADYGMNSYSVGIEMVHVGGSGYYPEEQLAAVDAVIAYIDAYFGFESTIIDHKAWRTGNSDTSAEFAGYLANYQDHRTHN